MLAFLRKGRFFHHLSLDDRLAELDNWRRSRLEIRRRRQFFASLAVFGMYSDLYGGGLWAWRSPIGVTGAALTKLPRM